MRKLGLFVPALVIGLSALAAEKLTYVDLVRRLADLETLALLPQAGEQCAQWSSYDRASRYDEATGKYVKWDVNSDGIGFIRKEGDKFVLAEMKGPGCLWRIWSARPEQGHVQIHLDGASAPAVDLPFAGYFDLKNEPFTRSALVHTVAKGWNNYTPIPYQKSCKIVADANWGRYFQFGYATFPPGTSVPTFHRQLSAEENAALDEANRRLTSCGPMAEPATGSLAEGVLSPTSVKTGRIDGPNAITGLRVKLDLPPAPADRDLLRQVTIEIRWDGEQQPSVWAPLGDFFGTAPGANAYRSLPCGLTEDGWWYANWYMPFAKSAEITIKNESQHEFKLFKLQVAVAALKSDAAKLGRFHAKWHRDAFPPAEPERRIDWTLLQTEGAGRFLGVMLHVWNPKGGWWGEGDEKFFIDGEKFPSTIGTGSEDYFGYAWCNPTLFQNAYHNQTISMGNKGHISLNRWHISDNVPFQKSFEGDIEKYFQNQRPTLYASTVYWYLAPGGKDPYPPLPLTERIGYWTERTNATVAGASEGERLEILSQTAGHPREQDMSQYPGEWSGSAQLWWTGARPGDKLELALRVKNPDKYKLTAAMTRARDYGIAQLYLDSAKLGGPIDLFNSAVVPTGPLSLGERELTAGEHKLTVEITGANPKAAKGYMFGLDYVKLEPVP